MTDDSKPILTVAAPGGLTEQMAGLAVFAAGHGLMEAAEWIMRVYGGMDDPLETAQEIRRRGA